MAQSHHSQQGLTAGLDRAEGKRRQKFLQKTQHVESGRVLFVALNKKDMTKMTEISLTTV